MATAPGDPFLNAKAAVDEITDHVESAQEAAIEAAREMQADAVATIREMAAKVPDLHLEGTGTAPTVPTLSPPTASNLNLPELGTSSFGAVTPVATGDLVLGTARDVAPFDIAAFIPSFDSIVAPEAPEPKDLGDVPAAPVIEDSELPDAPIIDRPNFPSLDTISIPEFDFPTLPSFDASKPEFEGTAVSGVLQWSEDPYEIEILDEQMAKLRLMWEGGTGLPPEVEQAMWERAASREDLAISRDLSAATIEFAARGFTLPPGMLVNRLDTIREDGQIRKLALGREILIKVADTQIENLRFACQQAIASEQVLLSAWFAVAGRQFEAAKIQLDSQLALYNAQVALFNARQSAYATDAQVFKVRLDAELARIQVYRAELDGEIAKGQINEQRVRIYSEQVRAALTDIEVYKAQMQGAQIHSDVQRTRVEVFKSQVQAFAETIQADKVRFEAYESRMKGEAAKANLVESQARAYAAYVSGQATIAEVGFKNQAADLSAMEMRTRAYMATLEKDKTIIQQQSAAIQANAEAHRANTSRYVAQTGAEAAIAELATRQNESQSRNAIALYEVEIRKYVADMEQLIRTAGLQLEALKSVGQAQSTLAAGAMAGISISSSISGGADISASGTRTDRSDTVI